MSKSKRKIDRQARFDFEDRLETFVAAKREILEACGQPRPQNRLESAEEACIEIAAAIKRAIRQTSLSREQVVDRINRFFGWPTAEKAESAKSKRSPGSRHLSYHMMNHYLSKPVQYPIPTFYLYAIVEVTGSLEPLAALAEPTGARVISEEEAKLMALGKIETAIAEMTRLRKEIKGGRL